MTNGERSIRWLHVFGRKQFAENASLFRVVNECVVNESLYHTAAGTDCLACGKKPCDWVNKTINTPRIKWSQTCFPRFYIYFTILHFFQWKVRFTVYKLWKLGKCFITTLAGFRIYKGFYYLDTLTLEVD